MRFSFLLLGSFCFAFLNCFVSARFLLLCGKKKNRPVAQALPQVNNSVAASVANVPQSKRISITPSQMAEQKKDEINFKREEKHEPGVKMNFSESKNVRKEQSVSKASVKTGNNRDLNENFEESEMKPNKVIAYKEEKQNLAKTNKLDEENFLIGSVFMEPADASKISINPDGEEESEDNLNNNKKDARVRQIKSQPTNQTKELIIAPIELFFPQRGGLVILKLENPTNKRMAIKMKCTDNENYTFDPVFFFLGPEGNKCVEIVRKNAPIQDEKAGVFYSQAPAEIITAEEVFKGSIAADNIKFIVIPITVL